MMTSCRNIDLGTSVLDLISCGCGRRQFPKTVCKIGMTRSYGGGGNLLFIRRDVGRSCKAVPTKPKEISLVNGIGEAKTVSFDLRQESSSKQPISLVNLFEVVADDLQTLNDNLLSIVGAENPVLISAAEQIFGAGGKRMRPGLVFLVSRATAELAGLKELTMEHRRLGEIIEMIHTASLIHDDVLDESDMRRVVDDILDFTQSSEQLGKPAGSDLAKGNLTAPVIFALEKEPRLREIIESEFCEEGSLEEGIELVREGGGIRRAQELAREKADDALKNLQCLPQSGFRLALEEM
ncbi:hypothetical protein DY000_02064238, partial [Brassica cretica]